MVRRMISAIMDFLLSVSVVSESQKKNRKTFIDVKFVKR